MRRPGFLGDCTDCWFGGFGLVFEDRPAEPWERHGFVSNTPSYTPGLDPTSRGMDYWMQQRNLTQRSKDQGWLTTGPVKQHYQQPVGAPVGSSQRSVVWKPFDF